MARYRRSQFVICQAFNLQHFQWLQSRSLDPSISGMRQSACVAFAISEITLESTHQHCGVSHNILSRYVFLTSDVVLWIRSLPSPAAITGIWARLIQRSTSFFGARAHLRGPTPSIARHAISVIRILPTNSWTKPSRMPSAITNGLTDDGTRFSFLSASSA